MSATVNEVRIIGNLGADPEVRQTANGIAVATLSVATTYRRGEVEHTEWHRVVLWQGLADRALRMRKGTSVWLAGRLQTRKWEKDGITQWSTEIVAENVLILAGWREDSQSGNQNGIQAESPGTVSKGNASAMLSTPIHEDEDIPF